jgi:hypothetical protein
VTFTPQPLYLRRGKRLWYPLDRTAVCVSFNMGLENLEMKKVLTVLELELQPLSCTANSESLYRLPAMASPHGPTVDTCP